MQKTYKLLFALSALFLGQQTIAQPLEAKFMKAMSGDTVKLLVGQDAVNCHLAGLQSPDRWHPLYKESVAGLRELFLGRPVTVTVQYLKKARRTGAAECVVKRGTYTVNVQHASSGLAWVLYSTAQNVPSGYRLIDAEKDAQRARRGVWSSPYAVNPYEFW